MSGEAESQPLGTPNQFSPGSAKGALACPGVPWGLAFETMGSSWEMLIGSGLQGSAQESGLELTCALPKLFVQPRAISAVQVQHPLRYFSAGEILDRHFNCLHLMPWIDEFFPNEK